MNHNHRQLKFGIEVNPNKYNQQIDIESYLMEKKHFVKRDGQTGEWYIRTPFT